MMYNAHEHVLLMIASGTQGWQAVLLSNTGQGLCNNLLVEANHTHHLPLSGLYKANILLQSSVNASGSSTCQATLRWKLSSLCRLPLTPLLPSAWYTSHTALLG